MFCYSSPNGLRHWFNIFELIYYCPYVEVLEYLMQIDIWEHVRNTKTWSETQRTCEIKPDSDWWARRHLLLPHWEGPGHSAWIPSASQGPWNAIQATRLPTISLLQPTCHFPMSPCSLSPAPFGMLLQEAGSFMCLLRERLLFFSPPNHPMWLRNLFGTNSKHSLSSPLHLLSLACVTADHFSLLNKNLLASSWFTRLC